MVVVAEMTQVSVPVLITEGEPSEAIVALQWLFCRTEFDCFDMGRAAAISVSRSSPSRFTSDGTQREDAQVDEGVNACLLLSRMDNGLTGTRSNACLQFAGGRHVAFVTRILGLGHAAELGHSLVSAHRLK
jgi:hypothetical protein